MRRALDLDEVLYWFHGALDPARRYRTPDLEADALSAQGLFYWALPNAAVGSW